MPGDGPFTLWGISGRLAETVPVLSVTVMLKPFPAKVLPLLETVTPSEIFLSLGGLTEVVYFRRGVNAIYKLTKLVLY